ncbi:MAG: diacylglycerol kinase [Verrucomicrobiales bacterium]
MTFLRQFLAGFRYAFDGLAYLLRTQTNARFHLLAAIAACALGFFFGISPLEWVAIALSIGLVFAAEILNTALEVLADRITTDPDPQIGHAKDLAAAAVLVSAIAATVVGLVVFGPKVVGLFAG